MSREGKTVSVEELEEYIEIYGDDGTALQRVVQYLYQQNDEIKKLEERITELEQSNVAS